MKNLNLIFELLLFPFLLMIRFALLQGQNKHSHQRVQERGNPFYILSFILFLSLLSSVSLKADGPSNNTCDGELISQLNNKTIFTTHTETGNVKKNNPNKDRDDYYYFDINTKGTIKVVYGSQHSTDFYFSNDNNGCGHDKRLNNGTSNTTTLNVTPGQRVYIRVKDEGNGRTNYNMAFTFTPTPDNADLSITKTVNDSTPNIGNVVVYTIVGRNNGNSQSQFRITDTLPTGLSFDTSYSGDGVSENRGSFSCSTSGQTATCEGSRNFNTGDTVSITIHAIVTQNGTITNSASIVSRNSVPDSVSGNNSASVDITPIGPPAAATDDNYTTSIDTQLVVTPANGLLSNDSGLGITITAADTSLLQGTFNSYDLNTGAFTFTPNAGFTGTTTFTYTITDTNTPANTSTATVSIVVNPDIQANNDSWSIQADTPLSENVLTNDIGTGISVFSLTQPANGAVVMQPDGNFVFTPTAGFTGTALFTYTITNDGGTTTSEANVSIVVTGVPIAAVNDNYTTEPGVSVDANLLDNDSGTGITVTSNSNPTLGTVSILPNGEFTYTPDNNVTGTDTFTYTITDSNGASATATVTIVIDTTLTSGNLLPFTLINPPNTRNVIGNYKIAGNTVLCLTPNTSGYGGTCTDDSSVTSNMRVSKYLDIDNDPGTWNSTSSYINFDAPYSPTRGIVWAGLFWGARISSNNTYAIHYAIENGTNSFTTIETGNGGSVDTLNVANIGSQTLKLKVDSGTYNDVTAAKFHVDGQTYAAFADVTSVIQSANLGLGKHTFTVANLTTMEGREGSPGAFGGWSLVVIYAEDYANGKPRNISIYNGYINIGQNNNPIQISGFKLPSSGTVQAQLSVFSGEGEYLYGRTPSNNSADWMKISDQSNSGYDYMPGKLAGTFLGNRDNMFDAQMDNILRDNIPGEFNDLSVNNVGVEVDNYDVSSLMTAYRDTDENISSIYIQMFSDNDYITPSMMAFSAELYVPELCYDYTLDIDGHVLESVNNEIKTPFGGFGQDLTTVVYLKSLDGDIPLSDVSAVYQISDTSQLQYNFVNCTTAISETGQYDYSDACPYTYNTTNAGFSMYIGDGKTSSSGGVINALENRYIKFDTEFHTSDVSTSFDFSVDYTVDYGSGAVPLRKTFTSADLCEPVNAGFFPELGYFNVTDSSNTLDKWNLFTQTSGRPFTLKLYAYDANNPTQAIGSDLNLSVEVEMIRADNFRRDANTACNDEHSLLTDVPAKFVRFDESKGVEFSYLGSEVNLAYRSTAMRVWYLTDVSGNGTLADDHDCTRSNQAGCVELFDRDYASGGECINECKPTLATGNCYDCLRSFYGRKVCSRDNFAIRPESFISQIKDSNQSTDTTQPNVDIADSTTTSAEFSVVAGYQYRFDINATNHISNAATPRYRQHYEPGSDIHRVSMEWWPNGHTVSNCNDFEDQNISLNMFDGSSVNTFSNTSYVDEIDQIGKYRFSVYDQNWTSADWDDNEMLHHTITDPLTNIDYSNFYYAGDDCIYGSSTVYGAEYPTINPRPGCKISSVHTNADNSISYDYLYARYYPYTFDVSTLAIGARPNNVNGDTYVYINTLDQTLYPATGDENMSYNIQGTFNAAGYTNNTLSNFVTNCYAEDVSMVLRHTYLSAIPTLEADLRADVIDFNTTNPGLTYPSNNAVTDRNRIVFSNSLSQGMTAPLSITQAQNVFAKDMQGAVTMDVGYNFDRSNNVPLNPRRILFNDFNVTYATQPATVYVDLKVDHKIFGLRDLDQNITFVYGRAKPNKLFYDDVTTASIVTPVSVVAYCDLGLTECQNRGLSNLVTGLVNDAQSNESSWWYSQNHSTAANTDGEITLTASGGGTVNPADPTSITTTAGIDNTITVTNTGGTPNVVNIDFGANANRWLIYNKDANSIPSPFYRVRFIGTSGWTGHGKTGNVVGDDINQKKSRRVE